MAVLLKSGGEQIGHRRAHKRHAPHGARQSENSMTSQEQIRTALLTKRDELTARTIRREDIAIEKNAESLDDIQQNADRVLVLNSLTRNWETNTLIAEALSRIADGTYGICVECDDPISEKRLAALPWARYCLRCQENADRVPSGIRWDTAA
jgi:DnaK suppressor protein